MNQSVSRWWQQLRIQHKVWAVLLLLCVPLAAGLSVHLYLVQHVLALQQQRHNVALAHSYVFELQRLAIDIEDGFRGYVLTQQPAFLTPLTDAEVKLESTLSNAARAMENLSEPPARLIPIEKQLKHLLQSKHELILEIQKGGAEKAFAYVRTGEGLRLSDRFREDLRALEHRLEQHRDALSARAESLSRQTFTGLWVTLGAAIGLGWIVSRILARSLTEPITRLQSATTRIGAEIDVTEITDLLSTSRASKDELGQLAAAYLEMARRIETHIREIEVLDTIGAEINTIGPDGLDGVLRRITDRAVELVQADVCLVLLRDERMGCWIVEAASGQWNDRLKNSIMLWEELPVSVQAYETKQAAVGERFRSDERPQVLRRNVIGDSMLAIPLLSQGVPFGVLSVLSEGPRMPHEWNQRLAKGLAQEAALAISNARLYETAQQKQRGLQARLRQLEHLAETLAHDLKGPGARMEELAKLLAQNISGQIDERSARWLTLIQENGNDIVRRVEGILEVARVGTGQGSVTAVDPRMILDEVLKAHTGEIERLRATIRIEPGFPLVACHSAYLRQLFDNLLSNALKYARRGEPPVITIACRLEKRMACFSVHDQGIGIPEAQRTKVFQPFVRLMQSDVKGSGIGLAVVKRIVELYGGRVWIEGAEGEGCTVQFTIPCLAEDNAAGLLAGRDSRIPEIVDAPSKGLV